MGTGLDPRLTSTRSLVAAFFVVHVVLASYWSDFRLLVNPTSRALPVVSLVEDGSLEITKLHGFTIDKARVGDRYYSDKAPLSSLAVVPFYALLHGLGAVPEVGMQIAHMRPVFLLGDFLTGALPFVCIMTLTLVALLRLPAGANPNLSRTVLASLPFYGSFLFVYAGSYYGHMLGALFVLLSWLAVRRANASPGRDALVGALVGLAVLAEYPAAAVIPAWVFHLWRARPAPLRAWVAFGLGGLPFLALLLAYNASITGSPFVWPYELVSNPGFEPMQRAFGLRVPAPGDLLAALWGLSLSPFRGLAVYAPIALLLAWVGLREVGARALLHPAVIAAASYTAAIACYYLWWGGSAYGPRHLAPPVALLFFAGIGVLARRPRRRWIFWGLCLFGCLCAVLAKATVGPRLEAEFANPLWQVVLPNALAWNFRPLNLASLWAGVPADMAVGIWAFAFALGVGLLARLEATARLKLTARRGDG